MNKLIIAILLNITLLCRLEAQVVVRLWEAESSAFLNITSLMLLRGAEARVEDKVSELNSEIRKKLPYYNFRSSFDLLFQINSSIDRIEDKISEITNINSRVPLLFNRKKRKTIKKCLMYNNYLESLNNDLNYGFSNNGNLLKSSINLVAELEEIESDLDYTLNNLTVFQRVYNLF